MFQVVVIVLLVNTGVNWCIRSALCRIYTTTPILTQDLFVPMHLNMQTYRYYLTDVCLKGMALFYWSDKAYMCCWTCIHFLQQCNKNNLIRLKLMVIASTFTFKTTSKMATIQLYKSLLLIFYLTNYESNIASIPGYKNLLCLLQVALMALCKCPDTVIITFQHQVLKPLNPPVNRTAEPQTKNLLFLLLQTSNITLHFTWFWKVVS